MQQQQYSWTVEFASVTSVEGNGLVAEGGAGVGERVSGAAPRPFLVYIGYAAGDSVQPLVRLSKGAENKI